MGDNFLPLLLPRFDTLAKRARETKEPLVVGSSLLRKTAQYLRAFAVDEDAISFARHIEDHLGTGALGMVLVQPADVIQRTASFEINSIRTDPTKPEPSNRLV